jgi:hypothetical protein
MMEYYDINDFDSDDFDSDDFDLLSEFFNDDNDLPEVQINIEDLTNRELLEELLSYADFKGYEEERFNALEDEIHQRLDKWLKDD